MTTPESYYSQQFNNAVQSSAASTNTNVSSGSSSGGYTHDPYRQQVPQQQQMSYYPQQSGGTATSTYGYQDAVQSAQYQAPMAYVPPAAQMVLSPTSYAEPQGFSGHQAHHHCCNCSCHVDHGYDVPQQEYHHSAGATAGCPGNYPSSSEHGTHSGYPAYQSPPSTNAWPSEAYDPYNQYAYDGDNASVHSDHGSNGSFGRQPIRRYEPPAENPSIVIVTRRRQTAASTSSGTNSACSTPKHSAGPSFEPSNQNIGTSGSRTLGFLSFPKKQGASVATTDSMKPQPRSDSTGTGSDRSSTSQGSKKSNSGAPRIDLPLPRSKVSPTPATSTDQSSDSSSARATPEVETPGSESSSTSSKRRHIPHDPNLIYHKLLAQVGCIYHALPAQTDLVADENRQPIYTKKTKFSLFLGQVRFETTSDQIVWMFEVASEGKLRPVHLHRRGSGCFMVYFNTEEERQVAQTLHETLLCDANGIWQAKTPEARQGLQAYLKDLQAYPEEVRLPRLPIIIRP